ncbi:hypothetical protein PQU92_04920 [Asticcacaulis sp. BYS171W]|uniref:Uncharacterized protein n=1 Tax=Asticcacaulis aquaticus TaxID=2984212 RepID=A0ABT5HRA1_9CAUL|nr:hypothetical protein [Asticcacaulis aquaticus]MDC7682605.1 hypothetical protein [Asticcacaulis aquaticus]
MSAIAYPIAHNALEIALNWPDSGLRTAAREREASDLSGKPVTFVRETLEPAFPSEAAARQHYDALLNAPFAALVCGFERTAKPRTRTAPVMREGQRWPTLPAGPAPQWKLSIGYWKIGSLRARLKPPSITPHLQARAVRKKALDIELTPEEVRALAHAPLMAYRPQKALDIGLFEFIPPDNPDIIIPDE